ncbi:MAG: aldo/keto reductase [Candidatus Latescibacteria bacterium]|nr:aldo/keto reductase [Candidatus Latescibacterota bacterium]
MKTRTLGKTGLDVGTVGLGTEYLYQRSRETVVSVVGEAIERGVNYMDFVFTFPEYLDHLGAALKGQRDKVIITGHLGAAEKDGHYRKTRDVEECEELFSEMLSRLHTEYIDVLFLQFVDEEDDYERVMGSGGLLELARRFRREGKAGFIGLSGHSVPVALKAVKSGHIDVLMFPINLRSDAVLEEKELFNVCASRGVGLVAMKPFAGGKLFQKEEARSITSVQCISYALSQIGVSTVVPGVKDLDELEAALHFLDATDEEKDFSSILPEFQQYVKGECVYCNHCLPCPAVIDIGQTIRWVDTAQHGVSEDLRADYQALSVKASACIECGSCTTRCPFEVDVISKMQRAVKLFEINASA